MRRIILSGFIIFLIIVSGLLFLKRAIEDKIYSSFVENFKKNAETFKVSFSRLVTSKYSIEDLYFQMIDETKSEIISKYKKDGTLVEGADLFAVFDKKGKPRYKNREDFPDDYFNHFLDVINRESDISQTYYIGFESVDGLFYVLEAEYEEGIFYMIGYEVHNQEFIKNLINLSDYLEQYYRLSGFMYICWQDSEGIIAASPRILKLSKIENDLFLRNVKETKLRKTIYEETEIIEVITPFYVFSDFQGIIRIGFFLSDYREELRELNLIVFSIFIILGGMFVIVFFYSWHKSKVNILKHEYYNLSNYTGIILQTIDESVLVIDRNNQVVYTNKSFDNLVGIETEADMKLIQRHLPVREMIEDSTGEKDIFDSNGNRKYILFSVNQFADLSGKEQKIILIRDLTGYRELEEKSRNSERMSLLGKISSMVAHEIRNPLNTISMMVQRFSSEFEVREDSEEFKHLNGIVLNEVQRLNRIVTRFLEYGRLPEPNKENTNIIEILNQVAEMVEYWKMEKGFLFEKYFEKGIVYIDKQQVLQVLLNILKNSFQALPAKNGKIRIASVPERNRMKIIIQDNGNGIPSNIRERIFDLYFTTKNDGTGFGLPIAKRILDEHQGEIRIESEESKGTAVVIYIPLVRKAETGKRPVHSSTEENLAFNETGINGEK